MPTVNKCPIFISSADRHSDLWPAFFALLKREWPEYEGTVYLNTQKEDFSFPGFDIVCTKTGPQRYFGETFLKGMDQIKGDHFLFFMIDFFLEGRVNVPVLERLYQAFLNRNVDILVLEDPPISSSVPVADVPECHRVDYPVEEYGFGFSAAFRRKTVMRKLMVAWETPWMGEWFGSRRANLLKPYVLFYHGQSVPVVPFDPAGVLHGNGRWFKRAVDRIDWTGIPLDFNKSQRGWHVESRHPRIDRMVTELKVLRLWMMSVVSLIVLRHRCRRAGIDQCSR